MNKRSFHLIILVFTLFLSAIFVYDKKYENIQIIGTLYWEEKEFDLNEAKADKILENCIYDWEITNYIAENESGHSFIIKNQDGFTCQFDVEGQDTVNAITATFFDTVPCPTINNLGRKGITDIKRIMVSLCGNEQRIQKQIDSIMENFINPGYDKYETLGGSTEDGQCYFNYKAINKGFEQNTADWMIESITFMNTDYHEALESEQ